MILTGESSSLVPSVRPKGSTYIELKLGVMFLELGSSILGSQGRRRPSTPADLSQCYRYLYSFRECSEAWQENCFVPWLGGVATPSLALKIGLQKLNSPIGQNWCIVGDMVASETQSIWIGQELLCSVTLCHVFQWTLALSSLSLILITQWHKARCF